MSNEDANRRARDMMRAFRSLSGSQRRVLQKRLGQAAITKASLGVRRGRDPYGRQWAPLTSRSGRPLRRTGNNIQRSWTAGGETPDQFRFGSRFRYLATHQYGAKIEPKNARMLRFQVEVGRRVSYRNGRVRPGRAISRFVYARSVTIPRRQTVPEPDTGGLGKSWEAAFSRTVRRYLEEQFSSDSGATS